MKSDTRQTTRVTEGGTSLAMAGQTPDTLTIRRDVLEAVVSGHSLKAVMNLLCARFEAVVPDVVCSVNTVDGSGRMWTLGSVSLPESYLKRIDGLAIGPNIGSCGAAAYSGKPVEVSRIEGDPKWIGFCDQLLPIGLVACWSYPIKAASGRVIGTFGVYFRAERGPREWEREVVEGLIDLCAVAIEHIEESRRIQDLVYRDYLTGLDNRAAFAGKIEEVLARTRAGEGEVALALIDLDDFKSINDTHGHWVADNVLRMVAERLSRSLGTGDIVARIGGDAFAIGSTSRAAVEMAQLATEIERRIGEGLEMQGRSISIRCSIGIAMAPRDGDTLDRLMQNAGLALQRAKQDARGSYCFFAPSLRLRFEARRTMTQDLRAAIASRAFNVVYQPIASIEDGRLTGFEALLRWEQPGRGPIPPDIFIPLAEELGLIGEIGIFVLETATAAAAQWPDDLVLSVNLSARQLQKMDFVDHVAAALEKARMPARRLELEITETVLLDESAANLHMLRALRAFGATIALDDFGVGYSSFSYLRSFPFDRIKIDMSFVRDIGVLESSEAIIRAIVGLSRDLGIRATAEGIETEAQRAFLRAEGCQEGQGHLFGRPLSAKEVLARIASAPSVGKPTIGSREAEQALLSTSKVDEKGPLR